MAEGYIEEIDKTLSETAQTCVEKKMVMKMRNKNLERQRPLSVALNGEKLEATRQYKYIDLPILVEGEMEIDIRRTR